MNAICDTCKEAMYEGGGCIAHGYSASKHGPAIKAEPYDGQWTGAVCHDCNAAEGSYHHPGCDVERCPACGLQAIGCEHCTFVWTEKVAS